MMYRVKRGFSLLELVIAILIVAILAGVGATFGGKQIKISSKEATKAEMQTLARSVEGATIEYGFLDSVTNHSAVENYFGQWQNEFLPCLLDFSNATYYAPGGTDDLGTGGTGVMFTTVKYADAWSTEYRIYYILDAAGETQIVLASAGPNSFWSEAAETGYQVGDRDDDITIKMKPRNH